MTYPKLNKYFLISTLVIMGSTHLHASDIELGQVAAAAPQPAAENPVEQTRQEEQEATNRRPLTREEIDAEMAIRIANFEAFTLYLRERRDNKKTTWFPRFH